MTLPVLRDDALTAHADGFALRLSLPWIRSLPLSSLRGIEVAVDGEPVDVRVREDPTGWWFVQDRVEVVGRGALAEGPHDIEVAFSLLIPYLPGGDGHPLVLPFRARRVLPLDAAATRPASVVPRREPAPVADGGWALAASAFNWTPDVIRAERSADDIAVAIAAEGTARVLEVELGQSLRTFPVPSDAEASVLGARIAEAGGRVSIVGASIDEWTGDGTRRSDDERLAFLLPQLRAAHALGAEGVRLPIGQAGATLLQRVLPTLQELDLTLYEEMQGHQTPEREAAAVEAIAGIDDPHIRLLVDISMLMPALPRTYLERMAGLPADLHARLRDGWRDPETQGAVMTALQSGAVPPELRTLFMNLVVRFGRSDADVLRPILPLVGAFHLKFWDLEDDDDRVSAPIRDLGALLRDTGFTGTLCSEWGGHEWLDDDATETTRAHLALAREALGAPPPGR